MGDLTRPLTVRRFGRDVFHIRSEVVRNETWYVCEIPNHETPFGCCSCTDYSVRIGSYLNRGELPERYRCKHIRFVLAFLDGWRQLLELQGIEADPADMIPWA